MYELDDLRAEAARFEALVALSRQADESSRDLEELRQHPIVGGIADLLARGDPGPALEAINQFAASLEPSEGIAGAERAGHVYLAAVRARLSRPDLTEIVAELENNLETEALEGRQGWHHDEILLQSVGAALLPLAGLDLKATLYFTNVFIDNFPSFSMPLGDYDLRATRWLAQLMDMGGIRAAYRERIRDLATISASDAPRAAARLRAWSSDPPPSDQTDDVPWMQGLLALVRSQLGPP